MTLFLVLQMIFSYYLELLDSTDCFVAMQILAVVQIFRKKGKYKYP